MNKLIYSILVAFIISFAIAPFIIPGLHKLKFGQNIREDGPQSHLKKTGNSNHGRNNIYYFYLYYYDING